MLELGKFLVNFLDHLAGALNLKLLVEVRNVNSEDIFKSNELLHFGIFILEVDKGTERSVPP